MNRKNEVKNESIGGFGESVEVVLRSYFSIQHIQSAAYFAKEAAKIEKQVKENMRGDVSAVHCAYVTASIFTAVAFLEANINEIFCDAYDTMIGKSANDSKYIPDQLINKLGRMWQLEIPRSSTYPILQKYQITLAIAEKPTFDRGQNPYQDVSSLIKLRNELIHYEPSSEIVQSTSDEVIVSKQKLAKMLNLKFDLNPLTGNGNPFWPDKCLSYGCCKWGIESSIAFTDKFFKRTDIRNKYEHIRDKLIFTADQGLPLQ